MSKLRPRKTTNCISGKWYRWEKRETHICCNCGSAHDVCFRVDAKGQVWSRWNVKSKNIDKSQKKYYKEAV